jgi:hypothetical protein
MELIVEPFTNYIELITKLYILDDIKGLSTPIGMNIIVLEIYF